MSSSQQQPQQQQQQHQHSQPSKYHRLECVGEGTYGRVYKARCTATGRMVAIKRLFPSAEDEGISATTLREIAILKEISHENIVELVDVLFAPPKLTLVFEICDCDLKHFMKGNGGLLEPEQVMDFLHQMMCGILHLHDRSILHRDLKPQNLLIETKVPAPGESPVLKICDFGLARAEGIPVKKYSHDAVTLWYRPPDVIMGSANYGFAIDIWSAGCIFAEMIAGSAIFQGRNEEEQLLKMFQVMGRPSKDQFPDIGTYPDAKKYDTKPAFTDPIITPSWENWLEKHQVERRVGKVGIDLLKSMLQFDPKQRITASSALAHPYFEEMNARKSRRISEALCLGPNGGLGPIMGGAAYGNGSNSNSVSNGLSSSGGDIISSSNGGPGLVATTAGGNHHQQYQSQDQAIMMNGKERSSLSRNHASDVSQ